MARTTSDPCGRCGGSGYLPQYRHVEGGVCFRCRGSGIDPGGRRGGRRAKRLSDEARGFLAALVESRISLPPQEPEPLDELLGAGLVAPVRVVDKTGKKRSEYYATERGHESYQKAVEAGLIRARPGEWVQ